MRRLQQCESQKEAQALSDFLETRGIESTVRDGNGVSVWVVEHDALEDAKTALGDFDPQEDYAKAAQKIRQKRQEDARPVVPAQSSGSGSVPGQSPVTMAMILVSVVVALFGGMGDTNTEIIRALLVVPIFEESGMLLAPKTLVWSEPWRLLTPMFIHFGLVHLLFNMMWLYNFGRQIEHNHGALRLVALAAGSMVLGSITQFYVSGPLFGGMSGVNYGLFGFVWMQGRYAQRGYEIDTREVVLLMGWFVLCATGLVGPVANAAHALGLVVGVTAGLPAYLAFRKNPANRHAFHRAVAASKNLQGWARVQRQYIDPYVPLWFLFVALLVLLVDYLA